MAVQNNRCGTKFEVLAVVIMNITAVYNITPCSPVEVHLHLGGTYYFHLQDRKFSQGSSQEEVAA
jgi:hypothetical protein